MRSINSTFSSNRISMLNLINLNIPKPTLKAKTKEDQLPGTHNQELDAVEKTLRITRIFVLYFVFFLLRMI